MRTPLLHQLIANVGRIRHVPTTIVQGRYDVVCSMGSAWALRRVFPGAGLRIVPDAGHSAFEPSNLDQLIEATDRFALSLAARSTGGRRLPAGQGRS